MIILENQYGFVSVECNGLIMKTRYVFEVQQ